MVAYAKHVATISTMRALPVLVFVNVKVWMYGVFQRHNELAK